MNKCHRHAQLLLILRICFTAVLLSRAYQAWYFDLPLRAIFWDQSLWKPFLNWTDQTWSDWLGFFTDARIVVFQKVISMVWLLSATVVWLNIPLRKMRWLLVLSLVFYLLLIITSGKDNFYRLGQFFEFTLQFWVVAFMAFRDYLKPYFWRDTALLALLLTFGAHGFYALGFYPRPGHFVQMTVSSLGVSEAQAYIFLNIAGIMDLLLVPAVLLKGPWRLAGMAYASFWGFMTSVARLWAYWDPVEWMVFLHQWLPQFGFRTAHFLVPLVLLLHFSQKSK